MNRELYQLGNPPRSIIPSKEEFSVQMSPFGDERWELDEEENRRRKETHRQYVYNFRPNRQTEFQLQERSQPRIVKQEEFKPILTESPRKNEEKPGETSRISKLQEELDPVKEDYITLEVTKPKSISELSFETPSPPNLYPLLKFPERMNIRDSMYKITNNTSFTPPVPGVPAQDELHELPPKTQFYVYKDIKFDNKVFHYGTHVPFWQFTNKYDAPS